MRVSRRANSKGQCMSAQIVEDKSGQSAAAKPRSNKKLILVGAAVAAVVLLGGGGGAYMFFSSGAQARASIAASHEREQKALADSKPGAHGEDAQRESDNFVDVPPMVVNLRSADGATRFLKIHIMLVPGPNGDAATLRNRLPLILDAYQPFLRELRPEDLAGSAAVFRIKEELLIRTNATAGEGSVRDILVEDLVQQ